MKGKLINMTLTYMFRCMRFLPFNKQETTLECFGHCQFQFIPMKLLFMSHKFYHFRFHWYFIFLKQLCSVPEFFMAMKMFSWVINHIRLFLEFFMEILWAWGRPVKMIKQVLLLPHSRHRQLPHSIGGTFRSSSLTGV